MHFVSDVSGGYRVFAVTGINTVSFAVDFSKADTAGLLGFAVERHDPTEDERYFMYGMKVFSSVIPKPDEKTSVTTYDHPIQSFVWDDFTAKPGRRYDYYFHPIKGSPKNLDRSAAPIRIGVETEQLYSTKTHDVFFNRGVASSQAYQRKFGNRRPSDMRGTERDEALQWLSRDLDDAILRFIGSARKGDRLLGCFYEFRYQPVAEKLKEALDRGVDVQLILDAKENGYTDKNGKVHDSFPRVENMEMVKETGLRDAIACWRQGNPDDIQHNKFMVLLPAEEGRAAEVWTGSTNLSDGGIHGQTNVGHWIRDGQVAEKFAAYWALLETDPGADEGDKAADARAKRKAYREAVMALGAVPTTLADIPAGISTIFSPRTGSEVLDMYVETLDKAKTYGGVTLAFGINERFKKALQDNSAKGGQHPVIFLLLEKRDKANPRSDKPFVPITARHNVYQAWGSYLNDPVSQWTRETNARALGLNTHVAYVHSKFLLKDPLGDDPVVISGSANFSDASTNDNDENMLVIRGDERASDIYFTEFNRLFNHYYFRSVREAMSQGTASQLAASASTAGDDGASLFLVEDDGWLKKYEPGTLRTKRVAVFTAMANARTLPPAPPGQPQALRGRWQSG